MKQIIKKPEPAWFIAWKDNFCRINGRDPLYADFRKTQEWQDLIQVLLQEQGYICCYCMKRIEGWDSHIEHFIPRNIRNTDPHSVRAENVELKYDNMFESCSGEHGDWSHCGRYKDREDSLMLLSPTEEKLDEHFRYTMDGHITAASDLDSQAMTTIRILNLDSFELKRHRQTAIYTAVRNVYDQASKDELIQLYLSKDDEGAFAPFCMAVVWALQNYKI